MSEQEKKDPSRRAFLRTAAAGTAGILLGCGGQRRAGGGPAPEDAGGAGTDAGGTDGGGGGEDAGRTLDSGGGGDASLLDATPECRETEDDIEGPFYLAGAPQRSDLTEDGMVGTRLTVSGRVLDRACAPIAGAVLDIWQCDDGGAYDRAAYRLRGQVVADAEGRWSLRTILPGHYLNGARYRPAHIHVKVHVESSERLTTQLYFADDPWNDGDPWFDPALALAPEEVGGEQRAAFDFVVVRA